MEKHRKAAGYLEDFFLPIPYSYRDAER